MPLHQHQHRSNPSQHARKAQVSTMMRISPTAWSTLTHLSLPFSSPMASQQNRWLVGSLLRFSSNLSSSTIKSNAINAATRSSNAENESPSSSKANIVLVVESPTKARKIQGYLGNKYRVLASYGHVRDLPTRAGSVDPNNDFSMTWELTEASKPRVKVIADAVRSCASVILATDPDREGEAISWHLLEELRSRGALNDGVSASRITFNEITKSAVIQALQAPRELSQPLIQAYMARRALDYLFGFHLSPLLWRKLPGARSAGRVQSVALRLIAERESSIESFRSCKYWTIEADVALPDDAGVTTATLITVDGAPVPSPGFLEKDRAERIAMRVSDCHLFSVAKVEHGERSQHPLPPYTTSTLQQDANKRYGFSATRTMHLAQQLYEAGHITYMRTDGVRIAPAVVERIRDTVLHRFDRSYLSETPRAYYSKAKNAQEAHEAIRPTDSMATEQSLGTSERDAQQLYKLILERTLASQMAASRSVTTSVEFESADGDLVLRSTASRTAFPGYRAIYDAAQRRRTIDSDASSVVVVEEEEEDASSVALDGLFEGQVVSTEDVRSMEHSTKPPGRFTEGSLVRTMEELGVGRPSTYAPTLKLLQSRKYVRKDGKTLHAEPLGRVLVTFLQAYFPRWIDYGFTSCLEESLDRVAAGASDRHALLKEFWVPFDDDVRKVGNVSGREVIDLLNRELSMLLWGLKRDDTESSLRLVAENEGHAGHVPQALMVEDHLDDAGHTTNRTCPRCGDELSIKLSTKGGPFVGCSAFPACTYTRPMVHVRYTSLMNDNTENQQQQQQQQEQDDEGTGKNNREEKQSLERAMALSSRHNLKGLVRVLGGDGTNQEILVRVGPYGPYLQVGLDSDPSMRRFPLPKRLNARYITLDYALSIMALPRELGKHPETGLSVSINNGTYGPYVSHGSIRRSIPYEIDPLAMEMSDVLHLLRAREGKEAAKATRGVKATAPSNILTPKGGGKGSKQKIKKKKKQEIVSKANSSSGSSEGVSALSNMTSTASRARNREEGEGEEEDVEHQPSQRLSAWNCFVRERGSLLIGLSREERLKKLSMEYNNLSKEEKSTYERMAAEDNTLAFQSSSSERKAARTPVKGKRKNPKLSTSGYQIFMAEKAEEFRKLRDRDGGLHEGSRGAFMSKISHMWRELSEEEKQKYSEKKQLKDLASKYEDFNRSE